MSTVLMNAPSMATTSSPRNPGPRWFRIIHGNASLSGMDATQAFSAASKVVGTSTMEARATMIHGHGRST